MPFPYLSRSASVPQGRGCRTFLRSSGRHILFVRRCGVSVRPPFLGRRASGGRRPMRRIPSFRLRVGLLPGGTGFRRAARVHDSFVFCSFCSVLRFSRSFRLRAFARPGTRARGNDPGENTFGSPSALRFAGRSSPERIPGKRRLAVRLQNRCSGRRCSLCASSAFSGSDAGGIGNPGGLPGPVRNSVSRPVVFRSSASCPPPEKAEGLFREVFAGKTPSEREIHRFSK